MVESLKQTINLHYCGVFEANPVLYDLKLKVTLFAKVFYFLVPGTNLEDGLSEHIRADSDVSESEDDDYDVYSVYISDNDDTASLDQLSDGEDEVVDVKGLIEGVEQLKRCVTFYALTNVLKLYYERNEGTSSEMQ
ncbi:hypothetical protein Tco_1522101 [Tanacetum coccineum]